MFNQKIIILQQNSIIDVWNAFHDKYLSFDEYFDGSVSIFFSYIFVGKARLLKNAVFCIDEKQRWKINVTQSNYDIKQKCLHTIDVFMKGVFLFNRAKNV